MNQIFHLLHWYCGQNQYATHQINHQKVTFYIIKLLTDY